MEEELLEAITAIKTAKEHRLKSIAKDKDHPYRKQAIAELKRREQVAAKTARAIAKAKDKLALGKPLTAAEVAILPKLGRRAMAAAAKAAAKRKETQAIANQASKEAREKAEAEKKELRKKTRKAIRKVKSKAESTRKKAVKIAAGHAERRVRKELEADLPSVPEYGDITVQNMPRDDVVGPKPSQLVPAPNRGEADPRWYWDRKNPRYGSFEAASLRELETQGALGGNIAPPQARGMPAGPGPYAKFQEAKKKAWYWDESDPNYFTQDAFEKRAFERRIRAMDKEDEESLKQGVKPSMPNVDIPHQPKKRGILASVVKYFKKGRKLREDMEQQE